MPPYTLFVEVFFLDVRTDRFEKMEPWRKRVQRPAGDNSRTNYIGQSDVGR